MRMKTQRILAALLSLVLLLALAPAGWAVDVTKPNKVININLVPTDKEGTDFATDIVKAKVQADLYLIAPAVADEQYDTYNYNFIEGSTFAGLKDSITKALKTDPADKTTYEMMLKSFSPIAQEAIKIVKGSNEVKTANEPALTTTASFSVSNLQAGMYLLVLRGADLKKDETDEGYFTTTKKAANSEYGNKEETDIIVTRALSDNYEFTFEPQIISLPTKMEGNNPTYNTAYGAWTDTLRIVAKPDWKPRNGILKITKTLTNYADLSKDGTYFEPMTFSFSVVGTKDGKEVYRKVVALSVKNPVDEELVATLEDIPVGAKVVVTEIYSGAHATGEAAPKEVTIQSPVATTDENGVTTTVTSSVTFTNVNNNTHRGGHGIENKFTFSEKDGWGWVATGGDGATSGSEVEER